MLSKESFVLVFVWSKKCTEKFSFVGSRYVSVSVGDWLVARCFTFVDGERGLLQKHKHIY
jgi:hypothetical protein